MKEKIISILIPILMVISVVLIGIKSMNKTITKYTIITDYKYLTMMNDGGSNTNIYYEIDINKKEVKKLEDRYKGFEGYLYQGKEIYNKKISKELNKELEKIIKELINKEDKNDTKNYSPFQINYNKKEKTIYNLESINKLRNILTKIDEYK